MYKSDQFGLFPLFTELDFLDFERYTDNYDGDEMQQLGKPFVYAKISLSDFQRTYSST